MINLVIVKDSKRGHYNLGDDYNTNANTVILCHGEPPLQHRGFDYTLLCRIFKNGTSTNLQVNYEHVEKTVDITDLIGEVITTGFKGRILKLAPHESLGDALISKSKDTTFNTVQSEKDFREAKKKQALIELEETYPMKSRWVSKSTGNEYKVAGHTCKVHPLEKGVLFKGIGRQVSVHADIDDASEFIKGVVRVYTSTDTSTDAPSLKASAVKHILNNVEHMLEKRDTQIAYLHKEVHKLGEHLITHIDAMMSANPTKYTCTEREYNERVRQRDILRVDVHNIMKEDGNNDDEAPTIPTQ